MVIMTAAQMRAAEQQAAEGGLSYARMMENAGAALARRLCETFGGDVLARPVIVCGAGNNGGDGLVAARKLTERGLSVSVVLACGNPTTVTAAQMLQQLAEWPVTVVDAATQPAYAHRLLAGATLVIDAVFGTGFHGNLPPLVRELFGPVARSGVPVAAVDLPSGAYADSGLAAEDTLSCRVTVTFHTYKFAHVTYPARELCGQVSVADIGMPAPPDGLPFVVDQTVAARVLARPADNTHKGLFGKAALLVGSPAMPGAAVLATRACLRCGVGLCLPVVEQTVAPLVLAAAPEAVCRTYEATDPPAAVLPLCDNTTALLAGCGLGNTLHTRALCMGLAESYPGPLVLDADGINSLRGHIDVLQERKAPCVLTPHPAEMARLTGVDVATVQADRMGAASRLAAQTGAVVVLKGAGTVIAGPNGQLAVCLTGNSALSKGGSGDVLAGMLVSLLAQGGDPFLCACAAVWLHGRAGEGASARFSRRGALPTDVIEALPALFLPFEQ